MRAEPLISISLFVLHVMAGQYVAQMSQTMRHVVNLHNFYRRHAARELHVANENKLAWSERLARRAANTVRCSSWRKKQRGRLSRSNINAGKLLHANSSLSVDLLIASWYSQGRSLAASSPQRHLDGCHPWYKCLEYRTMLNAKHHSMGCALLPSCGRKFPYSVLLCMYEGGSTNNEASLDFYHGPACSKCGNSLAFCQDGLCVACEESDHNRCECHKTCFKDGVGRGQLNSASCKCNCEYGLGPNCDEPCRNPVNLIGLNVCQTSSNRHSDPELGPLPPLDCQRFGHFCPEQCLCSPWPRDDEHQETLGLSQSLHEDGEDIVYVDPDDPDFHANDTELVIIDPTNQDAFAHSQHQHGDVIDDVSYDVDGDDLIIHL